MMPPADGPGDPESHCAANPAVSHSMITPGPGSARAGTPPGVTSGARPSRRQKTIAASISVTTRVSCWNTGRPEPLMLSTLTRVQVSSVAGRACRGAHCDGDLDAGRGTIEVDQRVPRGVRLIRVRVAIGARGRCLVRLVRVDVHVVPVPTRVVDTRGCPAPGARRLLLAVRGC